MRSSTVRYSALPTEDKYDIDEDPYSYPMEFGSAEGTFASAFTYANYNDLDRMGYVAPKRFGNSQTMGSRFGAFTYSSQYAEEEVEVKPMNTVEMLIYGFSWFLVAMTLPFSLLFALKFVNNSEKLVVLRMGRAQKTRGPGPTLVLPCIDSTHRISTAITAFNVPPLQVITTDRGLVELGASVFLKIRDPLSAVCQVQDRNNSTRTLANTMLYRYISKKRICEITNPQDRRILAANFKDELATFVAQFGIEVTEVEMSDVKVLKEGENMGMAALNSVASSETGKQIWNLISPHVEDYTRFAAEQNGKEYNPPATCSSRLIDPITEEKEPEPAPDEPPLFDVDQFLTTVNMAIDEHLTRAVGKVFQINCPGLSPVFVDLKHPPGLAGKGVTPNPDVVFECSQKIFYELLRKQQSPVSCYMNGSLKIKGQIQDALSLKYLAERVSLLL